MALVGATHHREMSAISVGNERAHFLQEIPLHHGLGQLAYTVWPYQRTELIVDQCYVSYMVLLQSAYQKLKLL